MDYETKSKAEIRNYIRAERQKQVPAQLKDWSATLCNHLLKHPVVSHAEIIGAYYPLPDEPDIRPLILHLYQQGKTILLASHFAQDIDELCDTVYEMDQGVINEAR